MAYLLLHAENGVLDVAGISAILRPFLLLMKFFMLMLILLLMFLLLSAIFLSLLLSLLFLHPQFCWRPIAGVPAAAGVPAVAGVLSVASILTVEDPAFYLSLLSPCSCRHFWCFIRLFH
jgi:hypothetical protein